MTILQAHDLKVERGGRRIVDTVSLRLEGGAFVAIIGPNGAGKSTLMSALAGLLIADAGHVTLDGVALTAIGNRTLAQLRAYLPQNPRAEWPISVERLIALGLTPQLPAFGGLPAAFVRRIDTLLAQFDLISHRDQPATTLSGGELARAMLARALVSDPALLLADEPLAGLDPRHALDGVARLRALADGGKLVIASIHELTLAARYATHVAVLREGRLIAFGPTAQTLTSGLVRDTFDVDACVTAAGSPLAIVDFVAKPAQPWSAASSSGSDSTPRS
ncbi:MAG TPA: ABC transporter ATP-binding protein [Sphingobium sp.]|nr:ABC transporter ATP-binding protein [Sphingobium sp.]